MSDNTVQNEAEENCESNAMESQGKAETTDADLKKYENITAAGVPAEDKAACQCHDDENSENLETDREPSKYNDSASGNDKNKSMMPEKETMECDHADQPDRKDAEKPIEMKKEPEETKFKVEDTEEVDRNLDCQQTRNLFETVGLVLRSNSSQSVSDLQTEEAIQNDGNSNEKRNDQGNPVESIPNLPESVGKVTPSYCEFCGFPAANSDIYHRHMKFHDRTNTSYACFICGMKYKKRDVIIDHYVKTHDIDEVNLSKCQSCKFVSSDDACLKEHVRKHFLIRPHACGICFQTFATPYNYTRHMEKHTEAERSGVGYSKPISRKRGSTVCPKKASNTNKRSRQNSKLEEGAKLSSEERTSGKPGPVKRKPSAESQSEEAKPEEPNLEDEILPKNYFVLPTKTINLVCSFCDTITLSKRELSQHLLSTHGDEIITLKPF